MMSGGSNLSLKPRTWFAISLLLFGAGAWMWHYAEKVSVSRPNVAAAKPLSALNPPLIKAAGTNAVARRKSYRLSNTRQTVAQLLRNDHAIILRNALIDTSRPLRLDIPEHLRAKGAPGSYIVQFDRPLNWKFYDSLKRDGAVFVSYIPNNAALVKADADQAQRLESDPVYQAVIPFEPYYKLDGTLLPGAVDEQPQTNLLSVTTFPGQRDATLQALTDLGAKLIGEDQSPFGPTLVVTAPPQSVAAIAQLPLAQEVESYSQRRLLNDLTRVQLGVSVDTLTNTSNYLNLSGSNVMVNINDTGVDYTHPDFSGGPRGVRLIYPPGGEFDFDGHGTHVAGIIAGNGAASDTITSQVPGSIIPGASFRGKATNAILYVQPLDLLFGPFVSDAQLEENASIVLGPTNLISNNSWGYGGSTSGGSTSGGTTSGGPTSYDTHAASYDAATRDAQPAVKGEQPLLFVFAAGDYGGGDDTGVDGVTGTIYSPATAKNVITVGTSDSPRFITNMVTYDGNTNDASQVFFGRTDNSNLVAFFSGCGNVGAGVEGTFGRFKPDVVAPGVFIVSCRSDEYVDPTNEQFTTETAVTNQLVVPGQTNSYAILIPTDASQLVIQVVTNSASPIGFTNGFIVVADTNTPPSTLWSTNALGANVVVLTNQLTPGLWNIGIAPPRGDVQPLSFDVNIFVTETNGLGDYFNVLSNMNSALGTKYVYMSGTSMSAGAVSGVLALMQEFLESQLKITPSPALLKALLINGSRSLGLQYDFNVQTTGANEQGWGIPNIANSIPYSLTNKSGASVAFFDQSPNNALATGEAQTFTITDPTGAASNSPVRISLVWTDPPGDPAAGVALVNVLNLTVTDSTGTNVFIGNDFFSGDTFSEANTGDAPDTINNVQNVYINNAFVPIVYPLTVTVTAPHVNVNAVTTRTNLIAQDFALVISSDNPAAPLTVTSNAIFTPPPTALITVVSNGIPLLHERVGANEPNVYDFATGATNGVLSQWHFFVFTNYGITNGPPTTNVLFATFLPPNLSVPRNSQADIDMYVSTDPRLLELNRIAVYNSIKEVGRGGTKAFETNSTAPVWYIGIKSEDQQAADFGFFAVAQTNAFSTVNPNGSATATGLALPVPIPDSAGGPPAIVFAYMEPNPANPVMLIQDVTVNLGIVHGNPSDLYGTLTHNGINDVLNHYSGPPGGFNTTYDDLQENPAAGDSLSDGPGSLKNYIGQGGVGLWMLTEADDALGQVGEVTAFSVTVTPQPLGLGFTVTIPPASWYKGSVLVPNDATNMTIFATYASQGGGPIGIFLTNFDNVEFGDYETNNINPPGGSLSLNTNPPKPFPPLTGGPWYYGIYNYNTGSSVTLNILIQFEQSVVPNLVESFSNNVMTPLITDGTTQSQICISNGQQVLDLSVGVRISDTNLDDLVLHLTSPQGTSVLLFENRGGLAAQNLGLGSRVTTNLVYTVFTEDTNLTVTPIKFAPTFASISAVTTNTIIASNGFESSAVRTYTNGQTVEGGWVVATNQVGVAADPNIAFSGNNYLALTSGRMTNTFTTIPGAKYELTYWARGPGIADWWPADRTAVDIIDANNGALNGGATYAAGEVGQAFLFNNSLDQYVSVPDSASLHFTNLTSEQWVNFQTYPTNAIGPVAYMALIAKPFGTGTYDSFVVWVMNGQLNGAITVAGVEQPSVVYNWSVKPGTWHHVGYTFDNDNSVQTLYVDGAPVASSPVSGPIVYESNPLVIGADNDNSSATFFFDGLIDETSLYNRALSPAEIKAIFAAGSLGKYNTNSLLPNFDVSIDGYSTNTQILTTFGGVWQQFTNSFIATNTQTTIEFAGNALSTLFDNIELVQLPSTNFDNYFLPEEPLTPFIGEDPQGCWTLDVWDTRTDSSLPDNGVLDSWDLQMTVSSTNVNLIVLTNGIAYTNGQVAGNSVTYFGVDVPLTASFATNILSKGSHPLSLLFNQAALPTGALPGDVTLVPNLPAATAGTNTLAAQGPPPPLVPGRRYFLGVQNSGPKAATFTVEVQFNVGSNASITVLTNQVAVATNTFAIDYYSFNVPSNATMVTFQVLNPTLAELDLYAREGLPVPGPLSFDYESRNSGPRDQFIVVTTNSLPVSLPTATTNSAAPQLPTTWYLAVYNNSGSADATYTILATYVTNGLNGAPGALDVVPLKRAIPKTGNAPPGYPTNLLYSFTISGEPAGAQFIVTNLSGFGNLELFVNNGALPTPQQSYSLNFVPGTAPQSIVIGTNAALPSLNGTWYIAVPNTSIDNPVAYSITATTITSGPVTSSPFIVSASISSPDTGVRMYWATTPGQSYTIQDSTDLINWAVVTNFIAVSKTTSYTDLIPVSAQPTRFFRLTSP
jgi:subtilisin-like proprotein convertase family protein